MAVGLLLASLMVGLWLLVIWTRGVQGLKIAEFERSLPPEEAKRTGSVPIRIHQPFSFRPTSTFAVLRLDAPTSSILLWKSQEFQVDQFSFDRPLIPLGNVEIHVLLKGGRSIYGSVPTRYSL